MYQVTDHNGQTFGPASLDTLRQWAIERRITPEMTLLDTTSGASGLAGDMLLGLGVFLDPIPASSYDPVQPQAPVNPIPAISYAYKGSDEPGEPPRLQTKAVAYFIDFVFGLMVYSALGALWTILLIQVNYQTWSLWSYLPQIFLVVTGLYFLLRDALFPGQSIGKRIANLKVVTTDGKPLTPMHSVLRNISAAPLILIPIPVLGYVALGLLIVAFCAECFSVMTQGKRFGDTIAHTAVVNA